VFLLSRKKEEPQVIDDYDGSALMSAVGLTVIDGGKS
jgi:hypothetical protein